MILAGDVGGTKTHVSLFPSEGELKMLRHEKYHSKDFQSLSQIIDLFLKDYKGKIRKACVGIAGPVENGVCRATNLPWIVKSSEIAEHLKIDKVWLINDLEANAYGIPRLQPSELRVLNEGKRQSGNAALISAGTGLGEAGLFWDGKRHTPFATEGGHADFAPRDDLEVDLWRYLHGQFGHVSYERVISGPGIYNIYRFLIDTGLEKEDPEVRERMQKEDPPMVVTEFAVKRGCGACFRALTWFCSMYGGAAGNLALKFLAVNGIYLGGGIVPKILEFMKEGKFVESFCAKGRFAPLLSQIPITIVLNENTALLGAASYARGSG
ncbi:MAG: glucokinase [Chlamydiales bacterium]|nr:glucokinase [Chlamydiales bacterium]